MATRQPVIWFICRVQVLVLQLLHKSIHKNKTFYLMPPKEIKIWTTFSLTYIKLWKYIFSRLLFQTSQSSLDNANLKKKNKNHFISTKSNTHLTMAYSPTVCKLVLEKNFTTLMYPHNKKYLSPPRIVNDKPLILIWPQYSRPRLWMQVAPIPCSLSIVQKQLKV